MTQLHVGIVGAGPIALEQHVPAWLSSPHTASLAVADPTPSARKQAAKLATSIDVHADARRLMDDPRIDVIDICTPTALHAEYAIDALNAGKHVLCEKPLATSVADARAVLDAQTASGRQLMAVQNLRYDPGVLQLRQHLQQCPLGFVYYGRCQWLRRRRLPARPGFTDRRLSGGGPLFDLGVHVLDLACWLLDWPIVDAVNGVTSSRLAKRSDLGSEWGNWDPEKTDIEDFAAGLIRFQNGAALSLETSWLLFQTTPEIWNLDLFGDRAGISWPAGRRAAESNRRPWDAQLSLPPPNPQHEPLIHDFAHAIAESRPVPIPSWQSAYVVAMLDALYRSAQSGKNEPVTDFHPTRT